MNCVECVKEPIIVAPQIVNFQKSYINRLSFADYKKSARKNFPFLLSMIDSSRTKGRDFTAYVDEMNQISWEFEDQDNGGRGSAYNLAQSNSSNRKIGTISLLKKFSKSSDKLPGPEYIVLDALAGDGTITRFLKSENIQGPTIISSDLSSFMVKSCMDKKLPCIRQSASHSLLKDSVLDGILVAYGSHHLDSFARKRTASEAFRTIKVGGKFVLHDFELGKATAHFFDEVVHPFSRTGHPHPHFSRAEMESILGDAGFSSVQVSSMSDPFILSGRTQADARKNALMHIYHMYDLVKIADNEKDMLNRLETCVQNTLGEISYENKGSKWQATIRRQALVAVGTKTAKRFAQSNFQLIA